MARRKRRRWSDEEKRAIIAQTRVPGASVSLVARRYDVNANQLFSWIRDPRFAPADDGGDNAEPVFLPVEIIGASDEARSEPAEERAGREVAIELPNGCRLTLRGGFDPDAVARLARGLGG